jgi:hypothetical protein
VIGLAVSQEHGSKRLNTESAQLGTDRRARWPGVDQDASGSVGDDLGVALAYVNKSDARPLSVGLS